VTWGFAFPPRLVGSPVRQVAPAAVKGSARGAHLEAKDDGPFPGSARGARQKLGGGMLTR
jgi:hypothetical protein